MNKQELGEQLEQLAPLILAGSWDNVGMLIEPAPVDAPLTGVLLTIDLNERVLDEAIAHDVNFIVTYHPILFGGAKRLRTHSPADRVILKAIEHNITVYSPHTALDSVAGGVTDWLLDQVGEMTERSIIEPHLNIQHAGMGRVGSLTSAQTLLDLISHLKDALSLPYLRVATAHDSDPEQTLVRHVAVCPGAGASVVSGAKGHDCIVTGEMRHHDVLAAQREGISVILTEHTNCERGYLPILKNTLSKTVNCPIMISAADRDPLNVL
ncbi:MAG: Nif3-like dinuclear metal center hexameric protein [Bradymonadia bacterium]